MCDFCGCQNATGHVTYHHGVLRLCVACWEAYAGIASFPVRQKDAWINGVLAHLIEHGGVLRLCSEECEKLYSMLLPTK